MISITERPLGASTACSSPERLTTISFAMYPDPSYLFPPLMSDGRREIKGRATIDGEYSGRVAGQPGRHRPPGAGFRRGDRPGRTIGRGPCGERVWQSV